MNENFSDKIEEILKGGPGSGQKGHRGSGGKKEGAGKTLADYHSADKEAKALNSEWLELHDKQNEAGVKALQNPKERKEQDSLQKELINKRDKIDVLRTAAQRKRALLEMKLESIGIKA